MKVGGVVLYGGAPRGSVVPLLLSRRRVSLCASSSSYSSISDHVSFVKDVAATQPPQHLSQLLSILKTRGESIISPGARQGLIPLAIPLSKNSSGNVTALLRWPTAPPEMEMPVVEVRKYGVWLLAKSVDQFIQRLLVEEDTKNGRERNEEVFYASGDAGEKFYRKGDFTESGISNLDVYLLKKVGLFPDIIERKVARHFEEGDLVSALVTGEFYTKKEHFPGFARPFVFNSEVLLRVGRKVEAKDAARGALKSPWWTLGCKYQDVANIAQWDDEQIEYVKEKVTEEGRQEDLKKGKAPAQVVLDEAAFLLDLASIEGEWDEYLERIAKCYEEAGASIKFHSLLLSLSIIVPLKIMSVEILDGATIVGFVEDEEAFNVCVSDLFTQLDTDKDGLLSYAEMLKELQRLRVFETHFGVDVKRDPDELARVYESMFVQFDHDLNGRVDLEEFKEETKQIMLAMANGLGFLPVQMALEHDSLLMKAVQREYCPKIAA